MRDVDVVIPVYDGLEETRACLETVRQTVTHAWARVIVINDYSPNPEITAYLRREQAERGGFVLLENEANFGFVASANRGLLYDPQRDVLILNSDVEVAGNWVERLRDAAYHHDRVASVTPFSNNATVCSFPNMCEDNALPFGLTIDAVDAQFSSEFGVEDAFQVPTGVGCCMYMRRDCMDIVGVFDLEAFGKGYGEENDWCQRASHAGYRNLHLANCFVYHRGGVSFGTEHDPRLAVALDTLDKKYPRYHADIQRYIARDPARLARVRAWLRLISDQPVPKLLMISHKLGGGAQQHIDELALRLHGKALCLLLVPQVDGQSVRLSCYDHNDRFKDGLTFDIDIEFDKLLELLRGLGVGRVHFHHTMALHTRLWGLPADLGCGYDFTVHDYYLVNGNPAMVDKNGRYVDEERADFDQQCAGYRPLPDGLGADRWRENQRPIIAGAERVIFPSQDCARRFQRHFAVRHPVIAWHPDSEDLLAAPPPQWHFPTTRPLRVLVLGALSKEKGADVLESVAASLAGAQIEFHLLGYAYRRLGGGVICHGPYNNTEVFDLVRRIDPDLVWFPATWPETYSYTLSIAIAEHLPVVVPDIGAFAERVQGRPHSVVTGWDKSTADWRNFWEGILERRELPAGETIDAPPNASGAHFYGGDYLAPALQVPGNLRGDLLTGLGHNLYGAEMNLSRAERILKRIWRFSRRPVGAMLIALVPFRLQRTIKQTLSRRPMHDIVGD
ncbi:MAG: glycosyltransferase [Halioglobus sp.]|nr:glycosyltransferase [Halioglobus sp.]